MTVSVVILTRGDRPGELSRAIASVQEQRGVEVELVVVGNGWEPQGLPPSVATVHLERNIGVGGRNAGVTATTGEILFFLDDDAWLPSTDTLAHVAQLFAEHSPIGMAQCRLVDPNDDGPAPRYWVPRLHKGDPMRPSACMYVLEAALAVRRVTLEQAGGWAQDFGYAHEGIDLAWRVWGAGWIVWYAADIVACHPAIYPTRHADYQAQSARNRVRLARRNLPWLLVPAYLGTWGAVELARSRNDPEARGAWLSGWRQGWRDPVERDPLPWSVVGRMAAHGRPPVV